MANVVPHSKAGVLAALRRRLLGHDSPDTIAIVDAVVSLEKGPELISGDLARCVLRCWS